MKLKDFLRNIKFEKPDKDTVIEAWIGLLMFVGVPFCIWLYYGGKGRHSGICRRTADILVGLFIQEQ